MSDVLQDASEVLRCRDRSACHPCGDIAAVEDGSGEHPGAVLRLVLQRHRLSAGLTGPGSGAQDNRVLHLFLKRALQVPADLCGELPCSVLKLPIWLLSGSQT